MKLAIGILLCGLLGNGANRDESDLAAVLEDVQIMERLLAQKIGEHSPSISGSATSVSPCCSAARAATSVASRSSRPSDS